MSHQPHVLAAMRMEMISMHCGAQQKECKTKNRALGERGHEEEQETDGEIQENLKVSKQGEYNAGNMKGRKISKEWVKKCNEGCGRDCENEIERKDIGH